MFMRDTAHTLIARLAEPRRFMQIVAGPRQTGKTTAIKQAIRESGLPSRIAAADAAEGLGAEWIRSEWIQARRLASGGKRAVLVIDEVQKIRQWSEVVKSLWDEDSWNDLPLTVVLSGSSSLLLKKGLTESLAGRYEIIPSTHWSLAEMSGAFGYGYEDYLRFGGFPGAAALRTDAKRWRDYMRDSIIEATISRDVLQLEEIRKPALMRALFELGAQYSAQELSYRKILGQLDDRGNTDIVKHYLDLLAQAGMLCGLQKYHEKSLERRASSPRLLVYDPALMTASWESRKDPMEDPGLFGHLVETAVGAELLARSRKEGFSLYWWRDGVDEVDFVVERDGRTTAIEVKSGRVKRSGLMAFMRVFPDAEPLVIGDRNTSVEDFLRGKVSLF